MTLDLGKKSETILQSNVICLPAISHNLFEMEEKICYCKGKFYQNDSKH